MPWCEPCQHYYAPSAMTPEGRCPDCGADLEAPEHRGVEHETDEDTGAPWHFKLLVVMLVAYLVYRGYEMFFA